MTSAIPVQGAVVRKPINLIQDQRKVLFLFFNFLVKFSLAHLCFFKIDFFCCKVLPNISDEQHLGVDK